MKRTILISLFSAIIIFSFFVIKARQTQYYKESRFLMGTVIEVTTPNKKAAEIVFDKFKELNESLSITKPDSEISRLNKLGSLKLGKDALAVVESAKRFYNLTDGKFDITVLPLLELWGFKGKKPPERIPTQEEIEAVLPLIGADKIIIDKKNSLVSFFQKGMKIDLGGIAIGYAVDEAVKALRKAGIHSALINAGGDIYCLGRKSSSPWLVGVRDPEGKGVIEEVILENKAIATSGDYERFIVINDKTYPHIINPKLGFPVDNNKTSVTVIADSCLLADVMSTALFVAQDEEIARLAEKAGISDYSIIKRTR